MKSSIAICFSLLLACEVARGAETQKVDGSSAVDKTINLRTNPVGLLFGIFGLSVDYRLSPVLSAGPTYTYGRVGDISAKQYGLSATWMVLEERPMTGWFLRGALYYMDVHLDKGLSSEAAPADINVKILGLAAGHQWYLDPGINFGAAIGASYYWSEANQLADPTVGTTDAHPTTSSNHLEPVMLFSVGFAI